MAFDLQVIYMYGDKTISAVIVAAGKSTRMGQNKILLKILGKSVLVRTVEAIKKANIAGEIIVVASEENIPLFEKELKGIEDARVVAGGETRGESAYNGIMASSGDFVLIHDGARPLVTEEIIKDTVSVALEKGAAAAGVAPKDTIKVISAENVIESTVDRNFAILIQTPQVFNRADIKEAYEKFGFSETDDCALMEKAGKRVAVTSGSYENIKLTTAEDIFTATQIVKSRAGGIGMRIGTGFDTHKLIEGRELIIGGVKIPHEKGLLGHSDADVLCHAIIDALFGAAALGDIGSHFPDTDEKYKGADSIALLREAAALVREKGYEIGNIDTTIIAQKPKMAPYIEKMRENLALAMGIEIEKVSVKAKTNEKMGFTGREEGIEARAVALLI